MSDGEKRKLLAAVRKARQQIADAKAAQQSAVMAALNAEISPVEIGAELGVTKARVYQIRDGR